MFANFLTIINYLLLIVRHLLSNNQTSLSLCEETRGENSWLNLTEVQYNYLMETVHKYDLWHRRHDCTQLSDTKHVGMIYIKRKFTFCTVVKVDVNLTRFSIIRKW